MIQNKTIVLCADDFGLNSGVSQGILKLAAMGRLSAVSSMVNMPDFILHAAELSALKNKVQTGLHFNVTEGYFLSDSKRHCFSLSELLIKTHLSSLKLSLIGREFNAQFDKFVQVMGRLPDFIDGHQHVHQFPVIRQVILDFYEQRLRGSGVSVRSTWPTISLFPYQFKAKVLSVTGGKALHLQLKKRAIPHNRYFAGIYDFAKEAHYRTLFRSWLDLASDNTLIMCHPGEPDASADPIAHARLSELTYFLSDEFLNDCNKYHVTLQFQSQELGEIQH